MHFQGLLACEQFAVVSEGIIVYSIPDIPRKDAEIELASIFLETEEWKTISYHEVHLFIDYIVQYLRAIIIIIIIIPFRSKNYDILI